MSRQKIKYEKLLDKTNEERYNFISLVKKE